MLVSNEYVDPPNANLDEENERYLWTPVERIEVSNYTPNTVRRIRSWLLANTSAASGVGALITDHELMTMLLTVAGTKAEHVDTGYSWPDYRQTESIEAQLKADGLWDEVGQTIDDISWLDYQTRLATQSLKPSTRRL